MPPIRPRVLAELDGSGSGQADRIEFLPMYSCAIIGGKLVRPIGAGSDFTTASWLAS